MTDDELDRALLALPLERPPAGLHERILSATIYRPATAAAPFRTWELWVLAIVLALFATATYLVLAHGPNLGARGANALTDGLRSIGLFSPMTYVWLTVGISCVWAISSLPLITSGRRPSYNG